MSVDRRIDLNLTLPEPGTAFLRGNTGEKESQSRQAPDAKTEERFAAAMAAGKTLADEPAAPSPFALFGANLRPCIPGDPAKMTHHAQLAEDLGNEVERLMVTDGGEGNRQVRMDLKEDTLPGVTLVIEEREGRLQVDFFCHAESSRLRLNQALPELATILAQRLQRTVLMRVQTDDEDDPCLLEQLVSV
jgi:hypothetical protein